MCKVRGYSGTLRASDAEQGRGIGTLLLEHLATIAHAKGIETLIAEVAADNRAMLDVFANSGFAVRETLDERMFHVEFPPGIPSGSSRLPAAVNARPPRAAFGHSSRRVRLR
jgi:GNAT superfamily N-acetyltransferase